MSRIFGLRPWDFNLFLFIAYCLGLGFLFLLNSENIGFACFLGSRSATSGSVGSGNGRDIGGGSNMGGSSNNVGMLGGRFLRGWDGFSFSSLGRFRGFSLFALTLSRLFAL